MWENAVLSFLPGCAGLKKKERENKGRKGRKERQRKLKVRSIIG